MDAGALLDLLGNENRRRILRLISRKPCYVTEISEHLGVSPKAVIDHLRKLEEAGLIESRTDEQRRKYFHIARNLRLEVTLAPYGFGMKSAYPASRSLDLSSCQHLQVSVARAQRAEAPVPEGAEADGGATAAVPATADRRVGAEDIAAMAEELDDLQDLARELSLAQRWVQGRIADVLEALSTAVGDDEDYLHAEIIAAVARGETDPEAIGRDLEVPTEVVVECLRHLEERGILTRGPDSWQLAP